MGDVIERFAEVLPPKPLGKNPPSFVVTPAHAAEMHNRFARLAAALEAAREDGERLAWLECEAEVGIRLHNGDFNGRHVGLGLTVWNTRRTLRAAIDQARGKAGQETKE